MVQSQEIVCKIALRIESAFCRKYPRWFSYGVNPGVWEIAAKRLLEVRTDRIGLPIDAELYVAVQKTTNGSPDPWVELTHPGAVLQYRKSLRRMILGLREELTIEVTRSECRVLRGLDLDQVLDTEGSRISPLSCYILAHRAGRLDLSLKYHAAALRQHRSCPLYRIASRSLMPDHAYPAVDLAGISSSTCEEMISFSRN